MRNVQMSRKTLFWLLLAIYLAPLLPQVLGIFAPGAVAGDAGAQATEYERAYGNSCLLAGVNMIVQGCISIPAGFALSKRLPRRTANKILLVCVFMMLLPQQALILPQYLILDACHLLNQLAGVVVMSAFQPFLVILYWFSFEQIDTSLLEAAVCDGASLWQLLRHICLPLFSPYLLVGSLISVVESWNMLEQPMTFLQTDSHPVLSTYFLQAMENTAMMRQTALAAVPMLLLFLVVTGIGTMRNGLENGTDDSQE